MTDALDIILMSDTDLNTVGGEQESTKIIIEGIKDKYSLGVIYPGELKKQRESVAYYELTNKKRMKDLIKNPIKFVKYIIQTRKIIHQNNPKIIHTQAQVSFFIVSLLKKMHLISRDIFTIHTERGLYTKYNNFFKFLFYFFMKDLNMLVTTTEFNKYYWEKNLKQKNYKMEIRVIANTAGELYEILDEQLLKKNDNSITVGFAGRYANWKDWPLAVDISKKLNQELGNKVKIKMVVGCIDSESLKNTNKMFNDLQGVLGDRFEGKVNINQEEMNQFYYDLDFFILTSKKNTESFGRTLVEAMSRLNIVLTTPAGGAVEVVGNPENVCYTANDFVKKIKEIYNDKELMHNQKETNLERVKNDYSLQNNIEKHKQMYNYILDVKA